MKWTGDDLHQMANEAEGHGWALRAGTLENLLAAVDELGWWRVPTRQGAPSVSLLRPTTQLESHPNSLSARFGMGQLPLHTDGAHLHSPPRFVALTAAAATETPTLLWRVRGHPLLAVPHDAFDRGIFIVQGGRRSFLAHARENGIYRFDPVAMSPANQDGRRVATYFESAAELVTAHEWLDAHSVLLIDNAQVVHGRAATRNAERLVRRVAFSKERIGA